MEFSFFLLVTFSKRSDLEKDTRKSGAAGSNNKYMKIPAWWRDADKVSLAKFSSAALAVSLFPQFDLLETLIAATAAKVAHAKAEQSAAFQALHNQFLKNDLNEDGSKTVIPKTTLPKLSTLSNNQRSLLFAELSNVCYADDEKSSPAAKAAELGFKRVEYYESKNAEGYRFTSDHDTVIAFRGTELCFNDMGDDVQIFRREIPAKYNVPGKVHSGFLEEAKSIWCQVREDILKDNVHDFEVDSVWFTGHSLGGAIGTVISTFAHADKDVKPVLGVVTFGSPRVGNADFRRFMDEEVVRRGGCSHLRWVNHHDMITKLCPSLFGLYAHCGKQMYLDSKGIVRSDWSDAEVEWDRLVSNFTVDRLMLKGARDHGMGSYLARIRENQDGAKDGVSDSTGRK